ncbi:MAG: NPCBM/NEW2 domain-containing protein, partial [Oceanipulchritudo sp.]
VKGTSLSVGGVRYPRGIWMNAPCRIGLRGHWSKLRFTAKCGHEDLVQNAGYPAPRIRFMVRADDRIVFDSGYISSGEPARAVDVAIFGVRTLELLLDSENGVVGNAQGDWIDPVVEYEGDPPELDTPPPESEPETGYPENGYTSLQPGSRWHDTTGERIQAHGGGLLRAGERWWWFGEHKGGPTSFWPKSRVDIIGVGVYSSMDLYNWRNEGVVLPAEADKPDSPLHPANVLERPKVIFNRRTGKYVLWVKSENAHYAWHRALVAVADQPAGPYSIAASFQPGGRRFGDFALYEEDGRGYLIFASGGTETTFIYSLSDDYLNVDREVASLYAGQKREAPAIATYDGLYFLITSGKSGWAPNPTRYAVAPALEGPWEDKGLLFADDSTRTSHRSQPTFLLEHEGRLIYLGDRWNQRDLGDSRYVWLPVEVSEGKLSCRWHDSWKL